MTTTIETPRPEAPPYNWPSHDLKNLVMLAPNSPYTRALLRIKSSLPQDFELHPILERPHGPLVCAPERALLELLSEIGQSEELEESRNILEMLFALRVSVLSTLLQHCTSVKVTRLCVKWAADLELPWAAAAREAAQGRLGNGRWCGKLQDGSTLNLPA